MMKESGDGMSCVFFAFCFVFSLMSGHEMICTVSCLEYASWYTYSSVSCLRFERMVSSSLVIETFLWVSDVPCSAFV